jgi:hypothetical protein
VGEFELRVEARGVFGPDRNLGLVIDGYATNTQQGPEDYLNDLLLSPEHRESTYAWIDEWGLLVCKKVPNRDPSYRDVRGRSSRGRLSQGEYYHHDGCSGPTKPRVVEIRFPHQAVPRQVATAVAPFRQVLHAMLELSSGQLGSDAELERWRDHLRREGELPSEKHDAIQGRITRALRRELDAESARAFYREVDDAALAYRAPWQMGESRLISNSRPDTGPLESMQHRRAYLRPHEGGVANGSLVKRWPAEELL